MSFSDRAMRPVRNSITSQMPEIRLEKEMAVAVGGGMFNLLDVINTDDVTCRQSTICRSRFTGYTRAVMR